MRTIFEAMYDQKSNSIMVTNTIMENVLTGIRAISVINLLALSSIYQSHYRYTMLSSHCEGGG